MHLCIYVAQSHKNLTRFCCMILNTAPQTVKKETNVFVQGADHFYENIKGMIGYRAYPFLGYSLLSAQSSLFLCGCFTC